MVCAAVQPRLRMICWLVISSHSTSSACPHRAACAFVPSVRMGPGATVFTLRNRAQSPSHRAAPSRQIVCCHLIRMGPGATVFTLRNRAESPSH